VATRSGIKVGWIDLRTQQQELQVPGMWTEFQAAVSEWRLSNPGALTRPAVTRGAAPGTSVAPRQRRAAEPPEDLASRRPGAAIAARAAALRPGLGVRVVARAVGHRTPDYAWRVGAVGEQAVGRKLGKLDESWRVLHGVNLGDRGDVDHLLIGPAGVLVLNTKRHPRARVKVGRAAVFVRGHQTSYIAQAHRQAQRVQLALSAATGRVVYAAPVLVFQGHRSLSGWFLHRPGTVQVLPAWALLWWLRLSGRPTLGPVEVDELYALARQPATWANA
jgi:hypothetical protein